MRHLLLLLAVLPFLITCEEDRRPVVMDQGASLDDRGVEVLDQEVAGALQRDMSAPDMTSDQGAGATPVMPAGDNAGEEQPAPSSYAELIQEVTGDLVGEEGAVGAVVVLVTSTHTEVVGLGLREVGGAPVDAQTVFQIGSVSKTVTGLMLASMIESSSSSLSADDPVNDHLTDLSVPQGQEGPITLEHLATHYSGLPNFPDNLIGPPMSPGQGYTRPLLSEFLSTHTLNHEPGARYEYSNLGYGLLGLSLSDADGASGYDQLLADRFVTPLELESTGLNRPAFLARVSAHISQGYGGPSGRVEVGYSEMGVLAGSGEILSTGEDMAVFLRVMCGLAPHPVEGAVERALSPRGSGEGMLKIAYGWDVNDASPETWSKSGLTAGFTTYVTLRRDPQVGVAILSNRGRHRAILEAARTLINRVTAD